jgi:hypothetical protein
MRFSLIILFISASVSLAAQSRYLNDDEVVKIAKEAYIYGYPMVENYRIMYSSTQDTSYRQYAPFNQFYHARSVSSPDDTMFVAPNVDTPYSYAVLNIKDEPVVITIPEFEPGRFVGVPLYDLYTHVIYTISPKNHGNKGGNFLIANERWKGAVPDNITKIIRSESDLIYVLIRTQLFNNEDLPNVIALQSKYRINTLSAFTGNIAPATTGLNLELPLAPQNPFSKPDIRFFTLLNSLLQLTTPHQSEKELLKKFASIGIVQGMQFPASDEHRKKLLEEGIKQGQASLVAYLPSIKSSAEIFGSREYLKNNYLGRAVGAWTGIYANEADVFLGIQGVDRLSNGMPFTGDKNYSMTFAPGGFPPVDAFWSITLYNLPSRFLYDNEIDRYSIGSTAIENLKRNPDGSVSILIQHEPPDEEWMYNWLPCPKGAFTMAFRCYLPKAALRNGEWKSPPVLSNKP